jgi:hypothetical protein
MAKKTRPTFSAPPAKAAPRAATSQWVYRTDAPPAIATTTAPVVIAAPVAAPRRSSGVVTCAARLLFPVALVTGLILEPLTACCRRKTLWRG